MNIPLDSLIKTACVSLCASAALLSWPVSAHAKELPPKPVTQTASEQKPNLVVILIDDMGYGDIGPFGSKLNRTPALDRMAKEGLKLTSFYAAPVCTPSRAQMITGCYAKRVSLPYVLPQVSPVGLSDKEHTVAELLKARGYATMAVGKWHLGDQPPFLPTRHGFEHFVGLPYSNDMGRTEKRPDRPLLPLLNDEKVVEAPAVQDTLTERYTNEAVKFITANKDKPFFLYLAHTAVHVPLHPGKAFQGKSQNGPFGDWVEECDWSVGRVLETLRQLKLDRNTLVLFTSDNGPWLVQLDKAGTAGPLRGGKGTTFDGGPRVPTIAWWPGKIAPGGSTDEVACEMDVLPTFVKLAGGEVPKDNPIDGKDIWPLLSGQTKESPRKAFFYFIGDRLEAVRSGPWKLMLVTYPNVKESKSEPLAKPALYNLQTDIGETTDVADQHPDIVARLQGYIAEMDKDLGVKEKGPGVRPGGRVENPVPLTKIPMEYD